MSVAEDGSREWLAEQRYRAVLEVMDGSPVSEFAVRYGVSRQAVYTWNSKYEAGGVEGLRERSRRPRTSPTRLAAEVEAQACEMRRAHPRWGARRIAFELAQSGATPAPSRATVHRVLVRNGLVRHQEQRHKRKYKRWQRETPMHLWQLDLVGGIYLADGRECKLLSGIDDHSRFVVVAAVLSVPSGRAVADAFVRAMRVHGVPAEVLTDNGKQFTGRFTKPRPAEVLFERVCRENGITPRLTKPRSPTTTGKVERWHRTLRRELLDVAGPFADLPSAQAAITAWVHTYNTARPHQALDMKTPASLFWPNPQPEPVLADPPPPATLEATLAPTPTSAPPATDGLIIPSSLGAVEFDTVVAAGGVVSVIPSIQRIRVGANRSGQLAHVWVDEHSVHIVVEGKLIKTAPSNLHVDDLHELRMRGARPAGAPPAAPRLAGSRALSAGAAVEGDRLVDRDGQVYLGGSSVKLGGELADRKVTLRIDGHLLHVVSDGVLAKTLPCPIPRDQLGKLRGARIVDAPLPAPAPGPISVHRKVPRDGVVMVARQRLCVGRAQAGKIVTIHAEDTHFRVTCDGADLSLHPRDPAQPIRRWKAKIHAARL
ncbi:IS481 family transposase [Nocardia sp. CA-107356]|uniref:IS481 family transposase n=1 Tax=Nocardia sp. CA-107356 TaxID=3239972 RepID=UPI003D8D4225